MKNKLSKKSVTKMNVLDSAVEKAIAAVETNDLSDQLMKYVHHELATKKEESSSGGFQILDENTTVSFIQNLIEMRQFDQSIKIGKPVKEMLQCQMEQVRERIHHQVRCFLTFHDKTSNYDKSYTVKAYRN